MTPVRPSWPSDEEALQFVRSHGFVMGPIDPSEEEWGYLLRSALAHFAPPAPEVASEAARSLVEELIGVVEGLADQQAMQDDFYREPLSRAKATLAKWSAARKEKP